jgi:RNA polymerase sigma factor (sigma-70 family)
MNKDQQWIQSIKNGQKETLDEIYLEYKDGFLDFAKRYPIPADVVLDVYQDSIIILYENIIQGKLNQLESSIKTYLYAIGKYKIFAHLKVESKLESLQRDELVGEMTFFEIDTAEDRIKLQKAYLQLGPKCQEVLKLFYYEGLKLEEIQIRLSYDSKNTVKSQKSRCLKQLKKTIQTNGNG